MRVCFVLLRSSTAPTQGSRPAPLSSNGLRRARPSSPCRASKGSFVFYLKTTRAKSRRTRSRSEPFVPAPAPLRVQPPAQRDAFAPRVARTWARTCVATSQPRRHVLHAQAAAIAHESRARFRRDSRQPPGSDSRAVPIVDFDKSNQPDPSATTHTSWLSRQSQGLRQTERSVADPIPDLRSGDPTTSL